LIAFQRLVLPPSCRCAFDFLRSDELPFDHLVGQQLHRISVAARPIEAGDESAAWTGLPPVLKMIGIFVAVVLAATAERLLSVRALATLA
jgi:hypothetical protein